MKHAATTQSHPSTLSKPSSGVHRYLLLPVLWCFTLVPLFFIAIGNFDLSSLVYFPREDFLSRVSLFIPHRITKLTFKIKTNWLLILCIYYGHFLLVVNHLWQTHLIYITAVTPSYPDLSQRSANEWDHYLMVENNWSDRVQYCALSSKNIGVNEKNNTKQNKSNNNIK